MDTRDQPDEPARGVTLDLFSDLEPAALPSRDGAQSHTARSRSRARRGDAVARHAQQPSAGAPTLTPAPPLAEPCTDIAPRAAAGLAGGASAEPAGAASQAEGALRRSVEQALMALPAQELQGVVGQVATAIVRSGEFQVALRAQLFTLVAPALTDALRGALSAQEIRQSLRDTFSGSPAAAQALQVAQAAVFAREAAAPQAPAPRMAQLVQPAAATAHGEAPVLGDAVLLAGYEPSMARQYKAALADAGYEALIVDIGPNDAALPLEAFQCAIACLPDDAMEHVESVISRHPLRHVLHVSATPRRLVEAVELVLPLPQGQG